MMHGNQMDLSHPGRVTSGFTLDEKGFSVDSPANSPRREEFDPEPGYLQKQRIGPYNPPVGPSRGTLTLGGSGGGNGALSIRNGTGVEVVLADSTGVHIKNTAGTELVTLNATGLTINQGSVVVYDSGGTTIMDSYGVVSTTQFGNYSNLFLPDHPDITSATYVDIGSATMSVVATRAANILCFMSGQGVESAAGFSGSIQMLLGTQVFTPPMIFRNTFIQNFILSPGTIANGTTTFKLQGASGNGTVNLQFGGGNLAMGYMVLGK